MTTLNETREWRREPRWRETVVGGVWTGARDDGQFFFVSTQDASLKDEKRKLLETFLDPSCLCRIPPVEEECPIHSEKGFAVDSPA